MKISTILEKTSKFNFIGVIFWLAVWQILSMMINQEVLLVSPFSALKRLFGLIGDLEFWATIFNSSARIITGFLISFFTGIVLAILSVNNKLICLIIRPIIVTIQTVPVVSFIILCLIWISPRNLSIFISFLMVSPIIYTNTLTGIESISKEINEVARVFKISNYKRIRYIYVSEVSSYVRSACIVSLGLCWKSGIAAEVIGIPSNTIGENLYNAKIYLSSPDIFAWTITIVILSIAFKRLFMIFYSAVEKRLRTKF